MACANTKAKVQMSLQPWTSLCVSRDQTSYKINVFTQPSPFTVGTRAALPGVKHKCSEKDKGWSQLTFSIRPKNFFFFSSHFCSRNIIYSSIHQPNCRIIIIKKKQTSSNSERQMWFFFFLFLGLYFREIHKIICVSVKGRCLEGRMEMGEGG